MLSALPYDAAGQPSPSLFSITSPVAADSECHSDQDPQCRVSDDFTSMITDHEAPYTPAGAVGYARLTAGGPVMSRWARKERPEAEVSAIRLVSSRADLAEPAVLRRPGCDTGRENGSLAANRAHRRSAARWLQCLHCRLCSLLGQPRSIRRWISNCDSHGEASRQCHLRDPASGQWPVVTRAVAEHTCCGQGPERSWSRVHGRATARPRTDGEGKGDGGGC